MADKRFLKRKDLFLYLVVAEQFSRHPVGRVVDITTDGFMLVHREPLPLNREYDLSLDLPEAFDGHEQIFFRAEGVYQKKDINPDYYDSGFKFVDLSPLNSKLIYRLMKTYVFGN